MDSTLHRSSTPPAEPALEVESLLGERVIAAIGGEDFEALERCFGLFERAVRLRIASEQFAHSLIDRADVTATAIEIATVLAEAIGKTGDRERR